MLGITVKFSTLIQRVLYYRNDLQWAFFPLNCGSWSWSSLSMAMRKGHLVLFNSHLAFCSTVMSQFIQPVPYWRDLGYFQLSHFTTER